MENHDFNHSQFIVDDLLDFPSDDVMVSEGMINVGEGVNSGDSSTDVNNVVDSCNSSFSSDMAGRGFTDTHFSSDLCVPYDDMAPELEWLSNFEEESFSSEDLQNLQIISGIKPRIKEEASQIQGDEDQNYSASFYPDQVSVPGKVRSKRSRIAPGNWTSRLLALTSGGSVRLPSDRPSSESSESHSGSGKKTLTGKKKDSDENSGGDGRRCLHCATDKTPQWRTGPMGPKTLCNACGVRYKSGRLVPEYRPAASPTFVGTKHSNSHRKVMELRRQKEGHRTHPHHHPHHYINNHGIMFDVPNGDDYLIHQHIGPDYRQMI